ncbi:hypothetical protein S7711_10301 [Stachybotrys chartarum IBT 7711]|uniref:Uncharacterized protein n=1 Tax=Stachybotrys chartarum (strain CBS 109288 / IBT 7711) TaxID=1280523 RepID=A0A084AF59_STACB|nr:hypothetical protein S7711_10301 [Stachybotrys chartarum IBT 7711]
MDKTNSPIQLEFLL